MIFRSTLCALAMFLALNTDRHGFAAAASIVPTSFGAHAAYRMSNDKDEAIIVPDLGRVMSFGRPHGRNFLWINPHPGSPYPNVGGDKCFIGPQSLWEVLGIGWWPPRPEWDGPPQKAEFLPGPALQLTGPPWSGMDAALARTFSFDAQGDFVITTTMHRTGATLLPLFVWPVTQIQKPDAVFVPVDKGCPYVHGVYCWDSWSMGAVTNPSAGLARINPWEHAGFKMGAACAAGAVAATYGPDAFVERSPRVRGRYPDGADGAGFQVEIYNASGPGAAHYVELEMVSPQKWMGPNDAITHSVTWSIASKSQGEWTTPELEALLATKTENGKPSR